MTTPKISIQRSGEMLSSREVRGGLLCWEGVRVGLCERWEELRPACGRREEPLRLAGRVGFLFRPAVLEREEDFERDFGMAFISS
jgi:hypothetical protein